MTNQNIPVVRLRVTVLLRRDDGRFCFVRHVKDGRTYWLLPGGGQNPFESLESAARRELEEELRIRVSGFRFLCLRETFSIAEKRHIHFVLLEGLNPDFSTLARGEDERVEGADFFNEAEMANLPVYPEMMDDLIKLARGEPVAPFRTLEWAA